MKSLAIYGAGMVAVSVYTAIKFLYKDCRIIAFLVSKKEGNPAEIDRIPVIALEELSEKGVKILIAVPENHHPAIRKGLEERNWKDYVCIDSRREAALMERYYKATGEYPSLHDFPTGQKGAAGGELSLRVYMTRFHKDVVLRNPCPSFSWLFPVQAGAALTELSVALEKDNTGDHISEKNGNYSELTALYWIWKNKGCEGEESDYLGLFHYRRILDITQEDLQRIAACGIDVILPYPTIHDPSIEEHHRRYVKDCDWEAMVSALEELAPEYAKKLPEIFSQSCFYNYNMLVARKKIFCGFCSWLFPILQRTEELSVPRGWERSDRYIGYLGESLTTLYFLCHKEDWKIAHTRRLMLT